MLKKERESLGLLIDAFSNVGEINAARQQSTEALNHLLGGTVSQLGDLNTILRREKFLSFIHGSADTVSRFEKYQDHYLLKDPLIPHFHKVQNTLFRLEEYLPAAEWHNSEFYNEFLHRLSGIQDVLALFGNDSNGHFWAIGFCHPRKKYFGSHKIRLVNWLAPYVRRGWKNLDRWERIQSQTRALHENTSDALAVVQVSADGRRSLSVASPLMREILALDNAGAAKNSGLNEFLDLSAKAAASVAPLVWKGRNNDPYLISARRQSSPSEGDLLIVRVTPQTISTPGPADDRHLAEAAGLTRREAAVFALLATGLGNREIARNLQISAHTVNAHVQNLFAKLGVSNRVEAINAVRKRN